MGAVSGKRKLRIAALYRAIGQAMDQATTVLEGLQAVGEAGLVSGELDGFALSILNEKLLTLPPPEDANTMKQVGEALEHTAQWHHTVPRLGALLVMVLTDRERQEDPQRVAWGHALILLAPQSCLAALDGALIQTLERFPSPRPAQANLLRSLWSAGAQALVTQDKKNDVQRLRTQHLCRYLMRLWNKLDVPPAPTTQQARALDAVLMELHHQAPDEALETFRLKVRKAALEGEVASHPDGQRPTRPRKGAL
jgi:hypothetical protein